jgi:hypothetical protein
MSAENREERFCVAETREDVIRCEGNWKNFGDKSREVMEAVRSEGLSKPTS